MFSSCLKAVGKVVLFSGFSYLCSMEKIVIPQPQNTQNPVNKREEILQSMITSFKIEGIHIPYATAQDIMQKVDTKLKKF